MSMLALIAYAAAAFTLGYILGSERALEPKPKPRYRKNRT